MFYNIYYLNIFVGHDYQILFGYFNEFTTSKVVNFMYWLAILIIEIFLVVLYNHDLQIIIQDFLLDLL